MDNKRTLTVYAIGSVLMFGGCATTQARSASNAPPDRAIDRIVDNGPARLVGDGASLRVENGVLAGKLEGGSYQVNITSRSARGSGPMGPIDVRIAKVSDGYDLSGLWNGGRVHFLIGDAGARGHLLRQISPEDRGYQSCQYDIEKVPARTRYSGLSRCLGDDHPLRFEVKPRPEAAMTQEENAVLLLAYFAAPPPVRVL